MAQKGKLYKYYLKRLFARNWGKMLAFFVISILIPWFLLNWGITLAGQKMIRNSGGKEKIANTEKLAKNFNVKNWSEFSLNNKYLKTGREIYLQEEKKAWEKYEEAKKGGDETKIDKAEEELLGLKRVEEGFELILCPTREWGISDFSLQTEGKNEGLSFWRLINSISFWTLATGFLFTWLTLSLIDYLFLHPKKSGEEAMVLTFTPGLQRHELLISKILAFLTYFSLLALVALVLPFLFYYFWIGSFAPFANFAWLFLYVLLVAPVLIFGLLLMPYILLSSWSSIMGSLFSWVYFLGKTGLYFWGFYSIVPHQITRWTLNPIVFTVSAVVIGAGCLTLYYLKSEKEDL